MDAIHAIGIKELSTIMPVAPTLCGLHGPTPPTGFYLNIIERLWKGIVLQMYMQYTYVCIRVLDAPCSVLKWQDNMFSLSGTS